MPPKTLIFTSADHETERPKSLAGFFAGAGT